jgi:hypothetical protein
MDLSKFSLSLNKKIIKYCQDIKHRLRNKEFGYIDVFPIHYETTTKPQEIKGENQQTPHQRGTSSGRPESIKQLSKIHQ